jgi:hypothetical protein
MKGKSDHITRTNNPTEVFALVENGPQCANELNLYANVNTALRMESAVLSID